jgi:subtilisin family serine protease
MKRWRISRLFVAAAATAAPLTMAFAGTKASDADALSSRQILVMLKIAPQHLHVGGGYGGRYGDAAAMAARRRSAENVAERDGFKLVDGWPMPLLGVDCYVMGVSAGVSIEAAVERASRDPEVAWSEPMQLYEAQGAVPRGDPLAPVEPASREWRLADLHRFATGRGVSVAIIDSKVDVKHPDLAGHFVADQNFLTDDPAGAEQHGTAVAGIIGAAAGNGIGIAGVAPGAQLMALRACWQVRMRSDSSPTLCGSLGIARALQYAIEHKADVINLSLSGPPGILLQKLISIALARGSSVVAAFDPTLPHGGFPASLSGVIAVADQSLQNLPANVYGAPARDIPTTEPGGKWYLVNGTSYAVAHVSGLVALVRERRSGARLSLARNASGRIDACATLLETTRTCDCDCRITQAARAGIR